MSQAIDIALTSMQADDGEELVTEQAHRGTLDERDGKLYIRYEEEGRRTTMVIAFEGPVVTIYRRGEVESWQAFQAGELTGGRLALAGSDMVLRVMTTTLTLVQGELGGSLRLAYSLHAAENSDPDADPTAITLGRFSLALDWHLTGGKP